MPLYAQIAFRMAIVRFTVAAARQGLQQRRRWMHRSASSQHSQSPASPRLGAFSTASLLADERENVEGADVLADGHQRRSIARCAKRETKPNTKAREHPTPPSHTPCNA